MKYGTILRRAECLIDYWPKGEDRDEWVAKCYRRNHGPIKTDTVTRARKLFFSNSNGVTANFTIPVSIFRENTP